MSRLNSHDEYARDMFNFNNDIIGNNVNRGRGQTSGLDQLSPLHFSNALPLREILGEDCILPMARSSASPPKVSGECKICGYHHHSGTSGKGGCGDDKGNGGRGDADKGGKTDKGGSGKSGDGGGGSGKGDDGGKGSGKGGDKGGGRGNDDGGDDSGDTSMNVDDPNVCSEGAISNIFWIIGSFFIFCVIYSYVCFDSESFADCFSQSTSCDINDKMTNFLSSKGIRVRSGRQAFKVPPHLRESYRDFKKAIANQECLMKYQGSKCEGLVNYAGTMAGAHIISTGNTTTFHNPMLCRCQDENKSLHKRLCIPQEGPCRVCKCDKIGPETILKEEHDLTPGVCWAFAGVGEVQIALFFPIIILGTTIHHPPKGRLPPGFHSSAPKNFDLWGVKDELDTEPHLLGKFEYKEDGGPTQIFEVQNPSATKFSSVKFNFTSNHGNPNYTAVYKVEVHGLLDNS